MSVKSSEALKAKTSAELLSYIINVTPELKGEIDLPVQGESIAPYGKLIMNNTRYKNAFLNTVNLIGLTVIKRNSWKNPWNFTDRGSLRFGQQIREIINDLCNVYDYNKEFTVKDGFLNTVVPNVLSYMHEVNFQKFYKTTTSDAQMAMAFTNDDLFTYIDNAISMLYESLEYDTYLVNKYMLCRRMIDGTITAVQLKGSSMREKVAEMKAISNDMTFRSPDYNPAGIRKASDFDNQRTILNTKAEAQISTEVLATSYFKDQADMKTKLALIDGFDKTDEARLTELLGDDYIPFTSSEKTTLSKAVAVIISDEWYMDYNYAFDMEADTKRTEFYNPQTLENNHFLHAWRVFSTSPFENACVFTTDKPAVSTVAVSPLTASVNAGQDIKLTATVTAAGFANKAVIWSCEGGSNVTISQDGVLHVPAGESGGSITVTATSVYDDSKSGTATITVVAAA